MSATRESRCRSVECRRGQGTRALQNLRVRTLLNPNISRGIHDSTTHDRLFDLGVVRTGYPEPTGPTIAAAPHAHIRMRKQSKSQLLGDSTNRG